MQLILETEMNPNVNIKMTDTEAKNAVDDLKNGADNLKTLTVPEKNGIVTSTESIVKDHNGVEKEKEVILDKHSEATKELDIVDTQKINGMCEEPVDANVKEASCDKHNDSNDAALTSAPEPVAEEKLMTESSLSVAENNDTETSSEKELQIVSDENENKNETVINDAIDTLKSSVGSLMEEMDTEPQADFIKMTETEPNKDIEKISEERNCSEKEVSPGLQEDGTNKISTETEPNKDIENITEERNCSEKEVSPGLQEDWTNKISTETEPNKDIEKITEERDCSEKEVSPGLQEDGTNKNSTEIEPNKDIEKMTEEQNFSQKEVSPGPLENEIKDNSTEIGINNDIEMIIEERKCSEVSPGTQEDEFIDNSTETTKIEPNKDNENITDERDCPARKVSPESQEAKTKETTKMPKIELSTDTKNENVAVEPESDKNAEIQKSEKNIEVIDGPKIDPTDVPISMDIDVNLDNSYEDETNVKEKEKVDNDVEFVNTLLNDNEGQVYDKNQVMEIDKEIEKREDQIVLIDCDEEKSILPEKSTSEKNKETDKNKSDKIETVKNSLCSLNNLDIFSDDDDEEERKEVSKENNASVASPKTISSDDKCINLDDDDDVMVIDDENNSNESSGNKDLVTDKTSEAITESAPVKVSFDELTNKKPDQSNKDKAGDVLASDEPEIIENPSITEKKADSPEILSKPVEPQPLVSADFLKTFKTKVSEMTREDLEEFCLLKIVEGVIDRSGFSELKSKVKTLFQNMEEWKRKATTLSKQNKDLKFVLKAVQEEQKKRGDGIATPLKITRSVGMQVLMAETVDRSTIRRKPLQTYTPPQSYKAKTPPKQLTKSGGTIPVPRLVPALNNSPLKGKPLVTPIQNFTVTSNSKQNNPSPNGVKTLTPAKVEKRSLSSMQSVTVDLTDDEPPAKQQTTAKNAPQAPVRLVSPQQLLTPRAQMNQGLSSPRNVYIPINSNNTGLRAGQTIMLKSVSGPRVRGGLVRLPQNAVRLNRPTPPRHPAPLPDVPKQPQPPNWKAIPPGPDLKITRVENGIVISWKIEGYQEDSYEEIASYQLYAYQETTTPPSTVQWKKIGDVKALPLPMACTLTQFMAGYKYFFAVRAVDIRSRIGPFSLPGSILLLK